MKLHSIHYAKGRYETQHWKYEDSIKYVFSLANNTLVEAGCFIHYKDYDKTEYYGHVIELSTSYGCPMKCSYCASSLIKCNQALTHDELFEIFDFIYKNEISAFPGDANLTLSFLGIGDLFYTLDNVLACMNRIHDLFPNIRYNLSSCYWTQQMINSVMMSESYESINTLQLTYISTNSDIVKRLIPGLKNLEYEFSAMLEMLCEGFIDKVPLINYVMIENVNSSAVSFSDFLTCVKPFKQSIAVRISSMNSTSASETNELRSPSKQFMYQLLEMLNYEDINSYIFFSYQNDNMNCGQLITERLN